MFIITCKENNEEKKLVYDEDIKYTWGEDIFSAVRFNSKQDAVDFILKEDMFTNIDNGTIPFLLRDVDTNSVFIKKIDEITFRDIANIKFDNLFNKLSKMIEAEIKN
jgi:hypothetical protein